MSSSCESRSILRRRPRSGGGAPGAAACSAGGVRGAGVRRSGAGRGACARTRGARAGSRRCARGSRRARSRSRARARCRASAYASSLATASAESDVAARGLRCAYLRRKCSASRRTSPRRSRSGGSRIGKTERRDASSRRARRRPRHASSRPGVSESDDAHVDGRSASVAPTRSTSPSVSSAQEPPLERGRERARAPRGRSSRRWASSKRPARSSKAPSKAPRFQPKSSRSSASPRNAAQVTLTNGCSSRGEPTWIARATTSFSEPGSPSMSTGDDVGATSAMRSPTRLHRGALAGDLAEVDRVALLALEVAGVVRELLAEPPVLPHRREARDRLAQDHRELLRVPRLLDVALDRARVDGVDEDGEIGVRREQDADRVGPPLLRALEEVDPAHPRHALIADDDRGVERARAGRAPSCPPSA